MSKNTSKIFALFAVGAALAGCSALIESKGNGIGAPCEITADGVDPCRTDKGYFCLKAVDGDGFRCALGREPAEDTGPLDSGPPPGTSGGPCEAAGTCLDSKDFCATAGDVEFLIAGSLCTSMCRTTKDCAAGEMCAASKAAAGVCVPKALIGRGTGKVAVGTACTTNNDCASGYCPDTKCREACAATTDCGAGETCFQRQETFKKTNGTDSYPRRQGLCLPKGPGKDPGVTCASDGDCSSGVCADFRTGKKCAPSCGSLADCSGACFTGPYLNAGTLENVRICAAVSGAGDTGASCNADTACKEKNCLQSTERCGALCTRPSDCATSRCRVQTNKTSIPVAVCAP